MKNRRSFFSRARTLHAASSVSASALILVIALLLVSSLSVAQVRDPNPLPGGSQDPIAIPKYLDQLPIPQAMPKLASTNTVDYYIIGARQFKQQILPSTFNKTTLFGYGSLLDSSTFSYPAHTIEAQTNRPVRVTWVNDLMDSSGKFVPHLFAIDQTLHWANPPQDCYDFRTGKAKPRMPDCRGHSQAPYVGPVPTVAHLHGAHVQPDSDGYPQAWFLPPASNIPSTYARTGSNYGQIPGVPFIPGTATYQYPNDQRSTALWYHDHVLGMTRANVYAGLAGFYLLRDSSDPAGLPKGEFEIPLFIQDKSFNTDGSLFFPGDRAFFEGVTKPQLQIPFIPDTTLTHQFSDVSPLWNPEYFGNVMVVNGKSWPKMNVQQRRYRLRIVNGDDTRALILKFAADPLDRPSVAAKGVQVWQIGADGGFLPKPVKVSELLIAPAERVDLIVDFSSASGDVFLINEGPDSPFGGGRAPVDFPFADPSTTGQVMKFVVGPRTGRDTSTPPAALTLPARVPLGKANAVRTVSVNEADSTTVFVRNIDGNIVESTSPDAAAMAPTEGLLGSATVNKKTGVITAIWKEWMDDITENPALGATEIWEIYDFTEDAHPIHLHQVEFEVINREDIAIDPVTGTATLVPNTITGPEAGETGTKDTVLVYPSKVTRVKAKFDLPGLYVWHCHILSHEDNEMMRPYCVGDKSACNTMPMP